MHVHSVCRDQLFMEANKFNHQAIFAYTQQSSLTLMQLYIYVVKLDDTSIVHCFINFTKQFPYLLKFIHIAFRYGGTDRISGHCTNNGWIVCPPNNKNENNSTSIHHSVNESKNSNSLSYVSSYFWIFSNND